MTLSLDSPRTPIARLLAFVEARAPERFAPLVAQARRDVAVVEGRLLLGTRPNPLLYDRPGSSRGEARKPVDAEVVAPSAAPVPLRAETKPAVVPMQAKGFDSSVVTIEDRDGTHVVSVARTQFVLEAALTSNVNIPFSCTLGGCGTCRVQLLEGAMELEDPNCLTPAELDAGYRLTCVGRVVTPTCRIRIVPED